MKGVSVIIPAYNAERYIAVALESVSGQSRQVAEIIVVDDGSTDSTEEVVREGGGSIRLIKQDHNGAGAARNLGVRSAQGEYLAFLDADDLWEPEKVRVQTDVLITKPAFDMVFGHVRQFISPELDESVKSRLECPETAMPGYHPGAMLIRREAFLRVGFFETGLKVGEFIDWYLKAVEAGLQSFILPQVVMLRRLHATNLVLREKQSQTEYARILKASLDRKRAARGTEKHA
jgi:glycosyltransferase involved in cell wall biosynthesis